MDPPPPAHGATPTVEARQHHLPRDEASRRRRGRSSAGSLQLAPLVEKLRHAAEHCSANELLRPDENPEACQLTSTVRTAGCGPACPVVWEGTDGTIPSAPIPIGL